MLSLLRRTHVYYYTINSSTKQLDTYGGNPPGVMRCNSVMDWSLIGCARCFVPTRVMSCAFDALRIVRFGNESLFCSDYGLVSIVVRTPSWGSGVFYAPADLNAPLLITQPPSWGVKGLLPWNHISTWGDTGRQLMLCVTSENNIQTYVVTYVYLQYIIYMYYMYVCFLNKIIYLSLAHVVCMFPVLCRAVLFYLRVVVLCSVGVACSGCLLVRVFFGSLEWGNSVMFS